MGKLNDHVALITGGGTGIGCGIAMEFGREGATVVVCGRREEELRTTVEDIKALGAEAAFLVMDQNVETDCIRTVKEVVKRFGQLDILVNSAAAVGQVGPVTDLDVLQWEETMRTNLTGLMIMCREAVREMVVRKTGAILNVSSNVGRRGFANRAPYVCSKWAMHGFGQTLALEVADKGIRVNTICPGPVMTDRLRGSVKRMAKVRGTSPEEILEDWARDSPMGRLATVDECAKVALFAVSDDSSAMTGQTLDVTAGAIMT